MSKKIAESKKDKFNDIDECLEAAAEFIRTHPNHYDHSDIPSEPMTNEQFDAWLHKLLRS